MTPDRWQQISQLYHAALTRDGGDRAAFLAEACGRDEPLRCEVESLLAQPASAQGFLDGPGSTSLPSTASFEPLLSHSLALRRFIESSQAIRRAFVLACLHISQGSKRSGRDGPRS